MYDPFYAENDSWGYNSPANNVGITQPSLQEEFNQMVNKVISNKGFWVGRYETSNMVEDHEKDDTNQIKVIKGIKTEIPYVNFYRMYAQQKSYSKLALTNSITTTSSMIWGCQWHQILIWMKDVKNINSPTEHYITNTTGMGKLDGENVKTGSSENYKVKNIYDMAGNLGDWTLNQFAYRIWLVGFWFEGYMGAFFTYSTFWI